MPLTQPDVYFGELVSDYAIVGAKGTPREFDGDGAKKVTYNGKGGISLSNPFTKLAFAIHDKRDELPAQRRRQAPRARASSSTATRGSGSRRSRRSSRPTATRTRSSTRRPGTSSGSSTRYTTIDNYPYSRAQLALEPDGRLADDAGPHRGPAEQRVNYIRNSVKATVDAYDGTVHLYQWDAKDPVLNAWKKVFPGLVQKNSRDAESIREHVRYPEDLFEVQRSVLEQYHVSNPVTFYNVSDKWTVPKDPAAPASRPAAVLRAGRPAEHAGHRCRSSS